MKPSQTYIIHPSDQRLSLRISKWSSIFSRLTHSRRICRAWNRWKYLRFSTNSITAGQRSCSVWWITSTNWCMNSLTIEPTWHYASLDLWWKRRIVRPCSATANSLNLNGTLKPQKNWGLSSDQDKCLILLRLKEIMLWSFMWVMMWGLSEITSLKKKTCLSSNNISIRVSIANNQLFHRVSNLLCFTLSPFKLSRKYCRSIWHLYNRVW